MPIPTRSETIRNLLILSGSVLLVPAAPIRADGPTAPDILGRLTGKTKSARVASETRLKKTSAEPAAVLAKIDCGELGEGYVMREAATGKPLEFALPESFPIQGARIIASVPNIQQFPVPGVSAPKVCSGCVPSAGANLVAYWASHGYRKWSSFHDQASPSRDEIREIVTRLRKKLLLSEHADVEGYTDDGIPLTGSNTFFLAQALETDAKEKGIDAKVVCAPFSEEKFAAEIQAGRPAIVDGSFRLPHKPTLSWGHEMTGIGHVVIDGVGFVGLRDNFLPIKGVETRWVRADRIGMLITVVPSKDAGAKGK